MHRTDSNENGWRLPAKELDQLVVQQVRDFLRDELRLIEALEMTHSASEQLRVVLRSATAIVADLENGPDDARCRLLHQLLHRVTLHPGSIHIKLRRSELESAILAQAPGGPGQSQELIEVTAPIFLKRRGVETKLIVHRGQVRAAEPDPELIALIVRAHRWFGQLVRGEIQSARAIARRDAYHPSEVSRALQLAFLAPDIVEAILAGRQPVELTPRRLMRIGDVPLEWHRQRRLLGFQT